MTKMTLKEKLYLEINLKPFKKRKEYVRAMALGEYSAESVDSILSCQYSIDFYYYCYKENEKEINKTIEDYKKRPYAHISDFFLIDLGKIQDHSRKISFKKLVGIHKYIACDRILKHDIYQSLCSDNFMNLKVLTNWERNPIVMKNTKEGLLYLVYEHGMLRMIAELYENGKMAFCIHTIRNPYDHKIIYSGDCPKKAIKKFESIVAEHLKDNI
jgi:hypothetical protein